MTDIYEQHAKAFSKVSAYVITTRSGGPEYNTGDKVATVAIKFPADGAGRLYAYVHLLGCEMTRGSATGYGYDKRSAAVEVAALNIQLAPEAEGLAVTFRDALKDVGGYEWPDALRKAGFNVLQAI